MYHVFNALVAFQENSVCAWLRAASHIPDVWSAYGIIQFSVLLPSFNEFFPVISAQNPFSRIKNKENSTTSLNEIVARTTSLP